MFDARTVSTPVKVTPSTESLTLEDDVGRSHVAPLRALLEVLDAKPADERHPQAKARASERAQAGAPRKPVLSTATPGRGALKGPKAPPGTYPRRSVSPTNGSSGADCKARRVCARAYQRQTCGRRSHGPCQVSVLHPPQAALLLGVLLRTPGSASLEHPIELGTYRIRREAVPMPFYVRVCAHVVVCECVVCAHLYDILSLYSINTVSVRIPRK